MLVGWFNEHAASDLRYKAVDWKEGNYVVFGRGAISTEDLVEYQRQGVLKFDKDFAKGARGAALLERAQPQAKPRSPATTPKAQRSRQTATSPKAQRSPQTGTAEADQRDPRAGRPRNKNGQFIRQGDGATSAEVVEVRPSRGLTTARVVPSNPRTSYPRPSPWTSQSAMPMARKTVKRCSACGTKLPENGKYPFCPRCQQPTSARAGCAYTLAVIVVLAIFLLVMALIFHAC